MVYLAATITPPFQNPDEPSHFSRAEQVSKLELIPVFVHDKNARIDSISADPNIIYPDKGGYAIDKGISTCYNIFHPIAFHSNVKMSTAKLDSAKTIKWGTGVGHENFGNTAIYPPVVYIMPAIGIAIGKLFHLSVMDTLYLSRLLNGALSITISFFALLLAKRSNILMFVVLLFPMSIALCASVSQDAILTSCSFLLVAIIDNAEFGETSIYRKWQLYAMIILLCIIATGKPPYVLFAFVFLFLNLSPKVKAIGIAIPVLAVLSWIFINQANFAIKFAPPELMINAKLQVMHIFSHPFKFIGMFFDFDWHALNLLSHTFIGVLGWVDLQFTNFYYVIADILLVMCFIIGLRNSHSSNKLLKPGLFLIAFITLIAVITAQYVTWAPLDTPSLSGMQGRYILPIFPFIPLALSSVAGSEKMPRLKNKLFILVLLFPIFTLLSLVDGLLKRYYVG
jgi:uncharacterized membrane protein